MSTARWKTRFLAISCVCVVAGGAVFALSRRSGAGETAGGKEYLKSITPVSQSANGAAARGKIAKQPVEVAVRNTTLRLTGSLSPDERSEVGSNAAGIVSKTCVDRGSIVKKGDLLVQLDPRDAQYALDEGEDAVEQLRVRLGLDEVKDFDVNRVPEVESAKLALELAEKTFRRDESLRRQKAIALESYDQAETEYHSAIHRHHLAVLLAKQLYRSYRQALTHAVSLRKAVEDCSICAPFDGLVAERNISLGERVISLFPGAKLVTLLRIDPLRLSLTVPQQDMAQIKPGATVKFQTDAYPGKTFTGTVRYITPAVDCDSRSLCVEAMVPNPDGALKPGLFVTAELQLEKKETDVFVPSAAVCGRGDAAAVFVIREGVVREQIVAVGESAAGRVRIASGLAPGDTVVTTPEHVRDGDTAL
jgi:RND family efflux transporter MFP subunit